MEDTTAVKPKIYSVSEFVEYLRGFLKEKVGHVIIQGEVSGFSTSQGKFVFFDLKDKESSVNCFMMKYELKVPLEDGMEIKVLGLPQLFSKSGKFHIRIVEIELVGAGALQKAFELLKAKLYKEGLFAPARKRVLPRFPERIGLITSPDAAAYTDVLRTLNDRWAGLAIYLYPVQVQGMGSIKSVVEAFAYFNAHPIADMIILTRGGGSLEDLQTFNSEEVARAVFSSKIPVVCGVGHERDESLADYVADVRATTPTNAATLAVPDKREILERISGFVHAVTDAVTREIFDSKTGIAQLMQRAIGRIGDRIENGKMLINNRVTHLYDTIEHTLSSQKQSIDAAVRLILNLNPRALLKKGYSLIWKGEKKLVKSISDVALDDTIRAQLADGELLSIITKKSKIP